MSLTKKSLLALVAVVSLLMLPNLILLAYSPTLSTVATALIMPTILLATLFAVLARYLWFAFLILLPWLLLAPLEAGYILYYRSPSSAEIFATIGATSPAQVRGFIISMPWLLPTIGLCLLTLVIGGLAIRWSCKSRFQWRGRVHKWVLTLSLGTVLAVSLMQAMNAESLSKRLTTALTAVPSIIQNDLTDSYPFGVVPRVLEYRKQWAEMRAGNEAMQSFRFGAKRATSHIKQRQIYVLAIGESSGRDHWQLFGYERETNPKLTQRNDLTLITDMVTPWTASVLAVPQLITRKPIDNSSLSYNEPSILRLMQEADYRTVWISNHYPIGKYNSPVAMYAYDADNVIWTNRGASWAQQGSYDEALIAPLKEEIESSDEDLFIVLHLLGSHMHYEHRYPPEFTYFEPTEASSKGDAITRMRNSFDNSVRYTDYVLAEVINTLEETSAITALWYSSDHGEGLISETCNQHGHSIGTKVEFEVPVFFWASPAYQNYFGEKLTVLTTNARRKTKTSHTFETLADIAGVEFPTQNKSKSLMSEGWVPTTRWVNGLVKSNYDDAKLGKGCGMLLPR